METQRGMQVRGMLACVPTKMASRTRAVRRTSIAKTTGASMVPAVPSYTSQGMIPEYKICPICMAM